LATGPLSAKTGADADAGVTDDSATGGAGGGGEHAASALAKVITLRRLHREASALVHCMTSSPC
jgi:hypothetical protein